MKKHKKHAKRKVAHKRNTLLLAAALAVLTGFGIYTIAARGGHSPKRHDSTQSHRTYELKSEKASFQPKSPAPYAFKIEDDTGTTLKDFDTVHEKQMHVIVVHKDLANFQHLHPDYDSSKGTFKFSDLTFPADGEYRVFADFTPTSSQMGQNGKLPVTLYEDVKVGDMNRYTPQPIGSERLESNADGFATDIVQMPGDSANTGYYSSTENRIPISISKEGQPYTRLQNYLGALGHMVVLSEGDLEFMHAPALGASDSQQSGTIQFAVNFPKSGKYKLFLQTQAEGRVVTTDYVLAVSNPPSSNDQQMSNMEHGGGQ